MVLVLGLDRARSGGEPRQSSMERVELGEKVAEIGSNIDFRGLMVTPIANANFINKSIRNLIFNNYIR